MSTDRRNFISTAGAALTTNLFTSQVRGANDKVSVAFIGMGKMGRSNLKIAMRQDQVEASAVCDIYDRNLNWAGEIAPKAKKVRDFREIFSDKSVDAVCIATPDHWHAYMAVEACKAGKDVYVEKPVCVSVDEGVKMVQAARKYNRVVQAGTMQRSAKHFGEATNIVKSGELGNITFVRTWNYGFAEPEGFGNPADGTGQPEGLNWDMWVGPAPNRPFNTNRFGVDPEDRYFSRFRYFWDYAGGMMTDWGVHWLDIVQMAFDEAMPKAVTALGAKFRVKDNRDTPDTLQVTYEYPGFIGTYENREGNRQSMFGKSGGILFCGDKATMFLDRGGYQVLPEPKSDVPERTVKSTDSGNDNHWANFLECMRTRQKPTSDIEKCQRSTTTCLLGNLALRSGMRLDWDANKWTTVQPEARKWLVREYRKPWKLVV